jgi:dihydroneopterin aldolase
MTQGADRISLTGITFIGYHGVLPAETSLGQRFVVDVTMECDTSAAGASDDIRQTVDYAAVYETVREIVTGPPCKLIESVAEGIAARVLAGQPRVGSVTVRVTKPDVRLGDSVHGTASVEIRRVRSV